MGIIETLSTKHLAACISISNDLLGVNYHDKVYFEKTIQQKQGIVLMSETKVIGFLIFNVTYPEYSNKMYGIGLDKSVGHIGSICVATSEQRRGFASYLMQKAITILAKEFSSIYILAWEYNGNINIEKILSKYEFNKVNHLDSIWKEACENNSFNCPVKENLCICSGIVYKLELNKN